MERLDPFRGYEDMFKRLWMRPMLGEFEFPSEIKLDVAEDDQAYVVKADLPGVAKDDIKVSIDGNRVAITAEVKKEKEEKGKNVVRSERYYGSLYRSFMLDHDVDDAKAEAKYQDGVLELKLPKKPGTATKQLTVK
jgi:HSP20 family protein